LDAVSPAGGVFICPNTDSRESENGFFSKTWCDWAILYFVTGAGSSGANTDMHPEIDDTLLNNFRFKR
jgi:hypothetical protein